MFWALVLTATATSAAPIDTLVLARIAGPEVQEGPTAPDLLASAEESARLFSDLSVRSRASVAVSDASLRPCGPDVTCLSDALEGTGVGRVVFAIVNQAETPPLVTVEVLDTAHRRVLASKFAAGADPEAVLSTVVEESLVVAGHARGANVAFDVTPRHAGIFLDQRPVTEVAHGLTPGRHALLVRADGYETHQETLDLDAGTRRRMEIALEAAPPITSKWWFWTAVVAVAAGATVAGLAAGGVFDSDEVCFGGPGVCR